MSIENAGSQERAVSAPNTEKDTVVDTPGYPHKGQTEHIAAIHAQEAQYAEATGNPDKILAELDSSESPDKRQVRLGDFVDTYFADIMPSAARPLAIAECSAFEDDCRMLFDEPSLELSEEDASDPELKERIGQKIVANSAELIEKNEIVTSLEDSQRGDEAKRTKTAEIREKGKAKRLDLEAENPTIPTDETERVALQQQTVSLTNKIQNTADEVKSTADVAEAKLNQETAGRQNDQANLNREHQQEFEINRDLNTVKELQANFDQIRAEKGTIGALRELLGENGVKSPEMRAVVQRVLSTAVTIQKSVPGKSEVVTRMLNQSNINLAAASPIQIFAGFLAEADKSNELTDDEKAQIRRVIGQSEKDFQTGTDAVKIAKSKEQIIDPETGEVIGEKYVHDSRDNMAELRPNLGTYMDGERMKLATKDGSVDRDVTGWPPEDIGLLAEVLEFHSFAEGSGITGMVESVGNIRFNVISDTAFDRSKVLEIRQVISALVGAGEGYDGDVFDPRQKGLLLKAQMRVLTDNDEAIEWNNDEVGTAKIIESLGLKKDGQPNIDVMKAFGSYVQENMNATRKTVQAHLHSLFPDLAVSPKGDDD